MFVPLSVLEFRDRAETYFGERVGVVDGDKRFTYRQFGERTHRLANALVELGVQPGDRVSFLTYNTHQLLEAYYGVLEAGAVLNPINIRLTPREIAYIVGHAGSKVLFFHKDFKPLVESLAAELETKPRFVIMEGAPDGVASDEYEALLSGGSPDALDARNRRERPGRALLHQRHDRLPQGRLDDAPGAVPPRHVRRDRPGLHAGRRRAARRPALPRQRLGHAAFPDHGRRPARHAAQVRAGRRSCRRSSATR